MGLDEQSDSILLLLQRHFPDVVIYGIWIYDRAEFPKFGVWPSNTVHSAANNTVTTQRIGMWLTSGSVAMSVDLQHRHRGSTFKYLHEPN